MPSAFVTCLLVFALVLAIGGLVTAGAGVALACALFEFLAPAFFSEK